MRLPSSLFFRTAVTLVISTVLLVAITLGALGYFVLLPLGKQSADDLASLIWFSAQTWVELPPETRTDMEVELYQTHRLKLQSDPEQQFEAFQQRPYLAMLAKALHRQSGRSLPLGLLPDRPDWVWVDIPIAGERLRFSFPRERIGIRPPAALIIIVIGSLGLALITALILSHRLSRPLSNFSVVAQQIGEGGFQIRIPEQGPDEIAVLAASFNRMSSNLNALIENRTTLLAGISHDLRTPLTRLALALEMLGEHQNPDLVAGLKKDAQDMDKLLRDALSLARSTQSKESCQEHDLYQLVTQVVSAFQTQHPQVRWASSGTLKWSLPGAVFSRVLENLLSNAIRYGEERPVTVQLVEEAGVPVVRVLDEGSGIPTEELERVFQPFYRLDATRNADSGGSGLGLAIVQQLCHSQGWFVRLSNRSEKGVEAILRLG